MGCKEHVDATFTNHQYVKGVRIQRMDTGKQREIAKVAFVYNEKACMFFWVSREFSLMKT